MSLCVCGCGGPVKEGKRYICGHTWKGKKRQSQSEFMKSNNPMKRPSVAEKNRLARLKYYKEHPEARKKFREWWLKYYEEHPEHNKGKNNPMYGKKRPELTKKFAGEGNPMYGRGGPLNPFYGKTHNKETVKKILEKRRCYNGRENPNWKGGGNHEPYGPGFDEKKKELIREWYRRVCLLCGVSENEYKTKLCIHHIDYDKNNNDHENLVPLCHSCNSKVNRNRKFWLFYFLEIQKEEYD